MNDFKSYMGYRKGSPYQNDPFIDIFSPEGLIDMSDTPKDLIGIDEYGNKKKMKAFSKNPYKFEGQVIREIPSNPYMQYGGIMDELIAYLFEDDEQPQGKNSSDSNQIYDLEETERYYKRRERELSDEQEYNLALSIAMDSSDDPFVERPVPASGFPVNPFKVESVTDPAKYSYNFFVRKGYPPHIAAGITANLQHESNFNTKAIGDQGEARGLAQWHPDRYDKLKNKFDLSTIQGNLEAVHYELQGREKGAFNKIKNANSPEEAAALVDRYYERSAGLSRKQRMNTARNIYNITY